MIAKADIHQVRTSLDRYVGSKVKIKSNKGRRNYEVFEGVITKTYPSIFVVELRNVLEDSTRVVSYSYADVLTKDVELSLCSASGS